MRILKAHERRLPDEVFAELVDLMYASITPVVLMGVSVAGVGALIAHRLQDPLLAVLTGLAAVVMIVRTATVLAYWRRRKGAERLPRAEARLWERRYAVSSLIFSGLLGVLSLDVMLVGGVVDHMLIAALIFGYGAGMVARLVVRPMIGISSLIIAVAPTAVGMAAHIPGAEVHMGLAYTALTLLTAAFTAGGLETMCHIYRKLIGQLMTRRDLASMARHDVLTGLPNRVELRERFEEEISAVEPGGPFLALHFLDLDRFKPVNDAFGHPTGDAVLQAVAGRLAGMLRTGDTAARLGGDEFVVVQSGVKHADEARLLAYRIQRVISAPYMVRGQEIHIGVSVGIALAPQDGEDLDVLAARADAALYQAKSRGRGTVAFWGEGAGPTKLVAVA
ncbi:diguanylate cyclase domain-containing protein [Phenylobacterium sp.]|uniref:diguanylate cyclase domain-containing protein n=1 Tax=Phenylobacterium sp. TaxID=1871053 RepID=UPI0035B0CB04